MTGQLTQFLQEALGRTRHPVRCLTGEELTPAGLGGSAARLAADLRDAGLEANEPVLVVIGNRPGDLAAIFGVWLSEGVAVPIHAKAAGTTRRHLEASTGARFAVADNVLIPIQPVLSPDRAELRGAALIIFTSGSTGTPKGVVIGHSPLREKLRVLDRLLRLGPDDTVVAPLQLTFIFGLWTSLLTLGSGASLMLVPRFSAEEIAHPLQGGATVLAAVPSMLRTILASPPSRAFSLRLILTGS